MATKKDNQSSPALTDLAPTTDQWRKWRESKNVLYWYAALLTLNIEPSIRNREIVRNKFPDVYKEYKHRQEVMRRRKATHPSLKSVFVDLAAKRPYVRLPGVLKFAVESKWPNIEEFENGISILVQKDLDGAPVQIGGRPEDFDELAKGEKYTYVRHAALVHLLKLALNSPTEFATKGQEWLKGRKSASNQAIGRAVAEAVGTFATSKNQKVPYGYGSDKNAKEFSKAEKFVRENF